MTDEIAPSESTPAQLRRLADDLDVFESTLGRAPKKQQFIMRDAAEQLERARSCFDALVAAIEAEGYEVLNSIDGTSVSIRRKFWPNTGPVSY